MVRKLALLLLLFVAAFLLTAQAPNYSAPGSSANTGNGTYTLNGSTSGSCALSVTATGGTLDLCSGNATVTGAGLITGNTMAISGNTVGGAATTPFLNITGTWNTTGAVDAGIFENITATAFGLGSKIMDLQVGGASEFSVTKAGVTKSGNTVLLTADSAGITATTAATATTVFTFPLLTASTNYSFHCSGTTTQATAGGGIGIAFQTATTAATNMEAHATVDTAAAASAHASSGSLSTTTETAIYPNTTAGTLTTQLPWYVDGSIEVGATAPTAFIIGFYSESASDSVVVKRDSYCSLLP